jgi:lipopolysaccharide transport system ATP-binding protein
MKNIAIKVDDLGKAYRIGLKEQKQETLMGAIMSAIKAPVKNYKRISGLNKLHNQNDSPDIFWANRHLSFEVQKGEVLGIIGKNGAGKSTLLKLLSRITEPTEGRIEIHGKVASLLEVGTGFNPDLTGSENIYLNGTILGLTKKEIDARYDDIIEFSGIEKFIETPVKRYSSGMKVRLAFAVAAHLNPEILIIDEVLAVGDAEFQKKCLGKMQEVAGQKGRTVLFVSHDLAAVKKLCHRAILLEHGQLIKEGATSAVIDHYLKSNVADTDTFSLEDVKRAKGDNRFMITGYTLLNENDEKISIAECGRDLRIQLHYKVREAGPDPIVILRVKDNLDQLLFICLSRNSYDGVMKLNKEEGFITCIIPKLPLLPGLYSIDICLKYGSDITDEIDSAIRLEVEFGDFFGTGKMHTEMMNGMIVYHTWSLQ